MLSACSVLPLVAGRGACWEVCGPVCARVRAAADAKALVLDAEASRRGRSGAAEVAAELGVSKAAVSLAQKRVRSAGAPHRGLPYDTLQRLVAVELRGLPARPALAWTPGRARKAPDAELRTQVLLRELADARKMEAVVVVTRLCDQIAEVTGVKKETQAQLTAAGIGPCHPVSSPSVCRTAAPRHRGAAVRPDGPGCLADGRWSGV
ncbi:hypothetical protein [Streptomyces filamentosus]|uniref:hypothetical protein n=1 Tax=Streptomyces filamentosus TaxID=67294 RepID=UPI003402391A